AIFTSIMLGRFSSHFAASAPAGLSPALLAPFKNPLQLLQILPQLQAQFAQVPNGAQLLQALLTDVQDSLAYAIQGSFLLGSVLMAVACGVCFLLKEIPLRKSNREEVPPIQSAAANPAGRSMTNEAALPNGRAVAGAEAVDRLGHDD